MRVIHVRMRNRTSDKFPFYRLPGSQARPKLLAEEAKPLTYRTARPGEIAPGAVLVDQADRRSSRNAACGRPLNSLRDRVGVSEVVLVALPERFGVSGRYLLYVMAERT